ncbi:MAG: hypothetical protein A4E31_00127 [Methanomassiliicoccales archaeon PtaU1.Bin030]|nr:MAG: hypothetical protein A4E31_00127 [Methanomassiliicoccales archaeon PtaU1.Bin030]
MSYPEDIPKDNNAALGLFLITIGVLMAVVVIMAGWVR